MTTTGGCESGVATPGLRSSRRAPQVLLVSALAAVSPCALGLLACGGGEEQEVVAEQPPEAPLPGPPVSSSPVKDRVIVVVVPGLDPDLVNRWRGELPNLDRLGANRSLATLANDLPLTRSHLFTQLASSRRGGAGGATGLDARTGVVDSPAEPFWVSAAREGVPTRVLWEPGPLPDASISGLWVVPERVVPTQDVAHWTLLTPGADASAAATGSALRVLEGEPPWQVSLPVTGGGELDLQVSRPRDGTWRVSSGSLHLDLSRGELGEPVTIDVKGGEGGKLVTRWAVSGSGGGVAISLVASGAAESPSTPHTVPASLAQEWAGYYGGIDPTGGAVGLFSAYLDGWVSADALTEELNRQLKGRSAIVQAELRRRDARLVMVWLPEVGVAGQAFVGLSDSQHPAWNGELASRHGGMMKSMVANLDAVVGQVRASATDGDRVVLVSDHAITSQRYGVDLNAALVSSGVLKLRPEAERNGSTALSDSVDWGRTTAFASGGASVYLNQTGRQVDGIVKPSRRQSELARVRSVLASLKLAGRPVIAEVIDGAVALPGIPEISRPDLVVAFADGFGPTGDALRDRVGAVAISPGSVRLTGGPPSLPARRAGLVLTSVGAVDNDAHLSDLGPSVRRLLGLPDQTGIEGRVWGIAGPQVAQPTPPAAPTPPSIPAGSDPETIPTVDPTEATSVPLPAVTEGASASP